jgi:uncharacterized membrane protein
MAEANKYEFTKLNTLAVVSLASALTLFGAPAALLTGFLALAQIKQKETKGRWMAITGIVLAFVSIALSILMVVANVLIRLNQPHMYFDDFRNDWDMHPMPGNN